MVAAGPETHHNGTGVLVEFGFRLPCRHAPIHDFLRASAPLLN